MHTIIQNGFMKFLFKNFMNEHMIMQMEFKPCNEMLRNYKSWGEYCKKNHSFWSFGWKVMPIWIFKHTLPWLDHISSTIHKKFMFLDFLERWEQDLKLSCWTKFYLKLSWWCKVEEKTFPFLVVWNYKSLTIFGNFSPDLKFFNLSHDDL